jgi:hypothetical protein
MFGRLLKTGHCGFQNQPLASKTRGKPWHFKYLTVNHIYHPLAESNGKIY